MDAKSWLSATDRAWRVSAYESFKRAPDRALDVSAQAEKFSEFNAGKVMFDAEWWALWEKWCFRAVEYARR